MSMCDCNQGRLACTCKVSILKTTNVGYAASSAAAPVPPAGDVEVLGYWCVPKGAPLKGRYIEARHAELEAGGFSESFAAVFNVTELVARTHVTRLTAEHERLLAEVASLNSTVKEISAYENRLMHKFGNLQSDLTKARECIANVLGLLRADKSSHAQYAILRYQEFPTDHQSAPAAKGGL